MIFFLVLIFLFCVCVFFFIIFSRIRTEIFKRVNEKFSSTKRFWGVCLFLVPWSQDKDLIRCTITYRLVFWDVESFQISLIYKKVLIWVSMKCFVIVFLSFYFNVKLNTLNVIPDSLRSIKSIQIVIKCTHTVCDVSLFSVNAWCHCNISLYTYTSHLCLIAISNWRSSVVFSLVVQIKIINSKHYSHKYCCTKFLSRTKLTFTHTLIEDIWSRFILYSI